MGVDFFQHFANIRRMKSAAKPRSSRQIVIKAGNAAVKIYRRNRTIRGTKYTSFAVADYSTGRRKFITVASEEEARKRAGEIAIKLANHQGDVLTLTSGDRASYVRAMELIRPTGASLEMVAAEYADAHAKLGGRPMAEAVNYFIKQHPATLPDKSVADVVAEMLAAKNAEGLSARHIEDLTNRLARFARDFQCQIAGATGSAIKAWIQNHEVTNRTRNNFRMAIQTLFTFARRQGYIPRDWNELEKVPVWKTADTEVEIFTPGEISQLLSTARPNFIPFLAIGAFAGLRSSEIERLDWSSVNLAGGYITVRPINNTKNISRRLVPILPNLYAWLAPHARPSGRVVDLADTDRAKMRLIEATKPNDQSEPAVTWKHNALRHSFCSYRLAVVKSVPQVALEAGNSPKMITSHYRELVTEEQANAWFAVVPVKE